MRFKKAAKKGTNPVISAIILSAVVIAIGSAVWSFAQGAATFVANDYVEGIMTLSDEVIERFIIEHICYNSDNQTLTVWIYNYGDIDIIVDVYASLEGGTYTSSLENLVASTALINVNLPLNLTSGDEVSLKLISRRGNNAYSTFFVP